MSQRHRVGIDSPPADHEPDDLTLGPVLPAGWDGDAWKREAKNVNSYWLRAWNQSTGQYAIAKADRYDEARERLIESINSGGTGRAAVAVSFQ